jgi:hypothetical protein
MDIKFTNSENCLLGVKEVTYFRDFLSILKQIEETLREIGAQKFFSSPDQKIQRVRESLAEFFFISALKKDTGKDWWLLQPKDEFPDFTLMTVTSSPLMVSLDQFELVEIQERCQTFDEMFNTIKRKFDKGYPKNFNLLIFINHKESINWLSFLEKRIESFEPFKSIWTVHLLFLDPGNIFSAVVTKIRPYPIKKIEVSFSDKELYSQSSILDITEKIETEDGLFFQFKPEIITELRKKLGRMAISRRNKGA